MPLVYYAMRYLLLCILLCTTTLSTVSITHVLLLGTHGYIEGLLHHLCHVVCIHRGGGLLLMGPWLRRCSCTCSAPSSSGHSTAVTARAWSEALGATELCSVASTAYAAVSHTGCRTATTTTPYGYYSSSQYWSTCYACNAAQRDAYTHTYNIRRQT